MEEKQPVKWKPREGQKVLFSRDVAAIWSDAAGKEVTVTTVTSYLQKSRPGSATRQAGRYADRPVPGPTAWNSPDGNRTAGSQPYWEVGPNQTIDELADEFRRWWLQRPGSGRWGARAEAR